jgi:hypothetical protein
MSSIHGKNANAIGGIVHVLNLELKNNPAIFGVTKCDKTRRFTEKQRSKKWLEQDKRCGYTGRLLTLDELVADHNIPHSRAAAPRTTTSLSRTRLIINRKEI